MTASGVSVAVGTIVSPRPGVLTDVFAGPDDPVRVVEVRADLRAPERVVPERDRVRAGGEQPIRQAWRDADAVGGVLAVHDARVDAELGAQPREALLERGAPGVPTTSATKRIRTRSAIYGTPSVAEGYTWMATFAPPSPE